jgi:hypothetical protein
MRRLLDRLKVDERASKSLGTATQITSWVSGLTFWLLFIVVLWQLAIAAQAYAGVSQAAAIESPLGSLLTTWLGRIVNVGVFLLVAWLVASLLRFLVVRVLEMTRLEERLGEQVSDEKVATTNVSKSIGQAVFWLTFLVFLPSILGSLGLGETATPIQSMVDQLLGIIPGIIGAVIILVLGTLLARIVRQVVTGFLEGVGVDRLGERVGLSREQNAQPLSALLGTVVYVLILIPVIIQALNTLGLPVISTIGTQLLGSVTSVILSILGAAVILTVAYYIARFISDIVSSLLAGIGINRLPAALGFKTAEGAMLSEVVGYVVLVAMMLLAVHALYHRRFFVHAEHFLHHLDDLTQRCIGMDTFHDVRHRVLRPLQGDAQPIQRLADAPVIARVAQLLQALHLSFITLGSISRMGIVSGFFSA